MRWPRARRRGGRLAPLGQDYDAGHRDYVRRLGPGGELWLRAKPFSAPPSYELARCLRDFAHVVELLQLGFRAQVLDVGCGPGWLSEYLARCGYWVTGIDISEDMIRIARERLAAITTPIAEGVEPVAEFHAMPVRKIPWRARFDAAVLYDAMHHFDEEVETLRVIRDALVPGGRIFVHEGVQPKPGSEGERQLIAEMERFGTLEAPFDPEYLVAVVEEAGFADVTRYVPIDDLVDVSDRSTAVAGLAQRIEKPEWNTLLAVNPIGADQVDGDGFRGRLALAGDWYADPGTGDVMIPVAVANVGRSFWPTGTFPFPQGTVTVGPYVRGAEGRRIELPRTTLPRALAPGEEVGATVRLPPDVVQGQPEVRIELVREGIAWFSEYGSPPLVVPLERRP